MEEESSSSDEPWQPRYSNIRGRMVNRTRELQFNSRRRGISLPSDIHHSGGLFWYLMQLRWPWLVLLTFVGYSLQVLVFAGLYQINKSGLRGSDGFAGADFYSPMAFPDLISLLQLFC
jgi:hypothetical protein